MNNQILGDKKKSSFDENLADKVNQIYDNMPDEPVEEKQNVFPAEIKIYCLNGVPMRTFSQWVEVFVKLEENIALMSDYYHAIKALMYAIKLDKEKQTAETLIEQLRRDAQFGCLTGGGLVGHTTINYWTDQNSASIADYFINVHGVMSRGTSLFSVPVLGDSQSPNSSRIKGEILLRDLLSINSGVYFIQSLFKTEDSADQILEVFKFFGTTDQEHKLNVFLPKSFPKNNGLFYSCMPIIRINGGIVEIILSEHEIQENVMMWGVKHNGESEE
ncbi:hypothetical protein HZA97_01085 [Candidatus Woesearchaeota archaeon]|nr:hypothetical protein [Candidatus Woesearchaeota archaeon]